VYYSVEHTTTFHYDQRITESVMELRMQPRTEGSQRCLQFRLRLTPNANIMAYRDYQGNLVHHFDLPAQHNKLVIKADSTVEVQDMPTPPDALPHSAWDALHALDTDIHFYDMLHPSHFVKPFPQLRDLAQGWGANREVDPLTALHRISSGIYESFAYDPSSTQVDTHLDHVLEIQRGVCQDFAHLMIALGRDMGIPCRYVSGYLFHREDADRSAEDATHAWVEAWLPDLGWIGFDPTNNLICNNRHIRVAIGRDYVDVPPTRGVFRGSTITHLNVAVRVIREQSPPVEAEFVPITGWAGRTSEDISHQQQQQQQQQ